MSEYISTLLSIHSGVSVEKARIERQKETKRIIINKQTRWELPSNKPEDPVEHSITLHCTIQGGKPWLQNGSKMARKKKKDSYPHNH